MGATFGSLCSGIEGIGIGLAAHGMEPVWFAEVDPDASAVLARHFPGVPNHGDITTAVWERVEPVDVVTAGYPCQPFSHAGRRKGTDDERHLWPHVLNAVRVLRPRYLFAENVAGHLSLGFDAVLADLAAVGMDAVWTTVRASDVGAPHRRERLFFVAADTDSTGGEARGLRQGSWDAGRLQPVDGGDAAPADPAHLRHEWGGGARRRGARPAHSGDAAADAACDGLQAERLACGAGTARPGARGDSGSVAWGDYEPAIRRWERTHGPAPRPVDTRGRLSPSFVEWMMGYPPGWVDGLGRTAQLRCLGNAVVPHCAALAWSILAGQIIESEAA